jgi:hypothetical protein
MSSTRLRSPVVLLALVACACSATARGTGAVPAPERQPSVTTDVVYGHTDGLALTFDIYRPAQPNGTGVISIVSGGYQSSVEMGGRVLCRPQPHWRVWQQRRRAARTAARYNSRLRGSVARNWAKRFLIRS